MVSAVVNAPAALVPNPAPTGISIVCSMLTSKVFGVRASNALATAIEVRA